jgi:hypothetical protein
MSGIASMNRSILCRLFELPPATIDFATMLRKTLASPLPIGAGCNELSYSIGELLLSPDPSIESLELVKEFAKDHRTDPESPLPPEVATVLYYASIASGLARCGKSISKHSRKTRREGFQWCERPWVDDEIRELIRAGLLALDPFALTPQPPLPRGEGE